MPNSLICVDASFLVRLLVPDRFSDEATKQWLNWKQNGTRIIAPSLIHFEASATFRRMVYLKALSPTQGDEIFAKFNQIDILISHDPTIRTRAWQLAKHFNLPRTYDMTYIAVAEVNNCPFWTADERLHNSVRFQLQWVHWIGEDE